MVSPCLNALSNFRKLGFLGRSIDVHSTGKDRKGTTTRYFRYETDHTKLNPDLGHGFGRYLIGSKTYEKRYERYSKSEGVWLSQSLANQTDMTIELSTSLS